MPHFPFTEADRAAIQETEESIKVLRELLNRSEQADIPGTAERKKQLQEMEAQHLKIKRAFDL